jgi:MFS family permease
VLTHVFDRLRRAPLLEPLRIRDFALLWTGMTISLFGDGIYIVAIAWQVYSLDNHPSALAAVGLAWMVPQVSLLLFGGVVSDRFDRRSVLITADVVRGVAIGTLGVLSVSGDLRLWHVIVLVAFYGTGSALFLPAFTAFVPDIVPGDLLGRANALDQVVRPLGLTVIGPLVGGVIVATAGTGTAFLVDAATFACSIAALLLVRARRSMASRGRRGRSVGRELREGFGYVRGQPWLWGILGATAISLLCCAGCFQVLLPYVVKNQLGGGAGSLGFVIAMAGVGALGVSLVLGQRGQPRRSIAFVCGCWAIAGFTPVGFAFAGHVWQIALVRLAGGAGMVGGQIVWVTLLQRRVPSELIGRVSSLDWLVSASLIPISFAVVGPLAGAVGVRTTLLVAGLVGGGVYLVLPLAVPRVRSIEREPDSVLEQA